MTAALPPRLAGQVARIEREIEAATATRDYTVERLERKLQGIRANAESHDSADDATMTKRLRRYRNTQGRRAVRALITGDRSKQRRLGPLFRTFEFIYRRWKKAGKSFAGVKIPVSDFEKHLNLDRSTVFRHLNQLEHRLPHHSGLQRHSGVIMRLGDSGRLSRFVVTLPESDEYLWELLDTMSSWVRRQESSDPIPSLEIAA